MNQRYYFIPFGKKWLQVRTWRGFSTFYIVLTASVLVTALSFATKNMGLYLLGVSILVFWMSVSTVDFDAVGHADKIKRGDRWMLMIYAAILISIGIYRLSGLFPM